MHGQKNIKFDKKSLLPISRVELVVVSGDHEFSKNLGDALNS